MSTESSDPIDSRRALLSALMDGDGNAVEAGCRLWRSDAQARADWHTYHLIGDVMRSDETVCDAAHDARLLARVRERLATEPVVLAPSPSVSRPAAAPRRRVPGWMASAAVAAGFAVVAGVLVVTRVSAPGGAAADPGSVLANTSPGPAGGLLPVAVPDTATAPSQAGAEKPQMLRSPELDRYLAAHRQYANGAVQVAPGGGVRNAAAVAPGR